MSVILYDKAVMWDKDHYVKMIIMFSIAEQEVSLFHSVFDNLIVLLSEQDNLLSVSQSKTYEEFINNIMNCIK